ncbi:MAG: sugar kinase [Streptosporangiaceae bacterium]|nr:sugar kinase [Streptosporangiaceae bacterium]MBV9854425.1 sugar kinase [Streptosporangiaceae bacterium]
MAGERGPDVVTVGETLAALRARGPLRLGGPAGLSVAGAESNVAIGLVRLGHAVRWVGRVGADELGELVLRTLRAEKVDVSYAITDDLRQTGLILFERRAGHLVRALYYRANSAGSAITPADVLRALEDAPRILHVTGITPALGAVAADAITAAVHRARALGTKVCLDVNYRSRLWTAEQARAALRPLAGLADILIASAGELPLLADAADGPGPAGDTETRTAQALLARGTGEVVITRGAAGATAIRAGERVSLAAPQVPVVDVVGAGDAFAAGYLSGLLDGLDVPQRLDRAVTTGAFAVAAEGDWEGLPTRAELSGLDVSGNTTLR